MREAKIYRKRSPTKIGLLVSGLHNRKKRLAEFPRKVFVVWMIEYGIKLPCDYFFDRIFYEVVLEVQILRVRDCKTRHDNKSNAGECIRERDDKMCAIMCARTAAETNLTLTHKQVPPRIRDNC